VGGSRFLRGDSGRRGICRASLLFLALLALVASAGCGKSGQGAETDPEKGSDAELLNLALARELVLVEAYTDGVRFTHGALRGVTRRFRAYEREYIDAITKAIRGLGGETEAEPSDLDLSEVKGQADFLDLAYRLEGSAVSEYLDEVPQLFTDAPRTLAASLAAGHAQHLVVLRQALGTGWGGAVPEAFESGEEPPPQNSAMISP
jgi:Ferritin-like domain